MALEIDSLRLAGIDDRNISTIRQYEAYLQSVLPPTEIIRDFLIDVDMQPVLSDLYLFTENFLIEVPDFVTFYDGKSHTKKLSFTIHPLKNAIVFLNQKISEATDKYPRTVEVNIRFRTGTAFSFSEMKENSQKLEYISHTYLIPNIVRS